MVRTRAESNIMDKVPPELMSYLDQRFNQLLSSLAEKKDINKLQNDVKSLLKKIDDQQTEISSLEAKLEKQATQIDILEARNVLLENHVNHLRSSHESQEQYSRRLCLRIDGMELPQQETSEQCLEKVKKIFEELEVTVPDAVLDRAHRIGQIKKRNGKTYQQVIVRFTTWRHRTYVYRARKSASSVKIRLDLTKDRLNLLLMAREVLKSYSDQFFAFADVNCTTRVNIDGKLSPFSSKQDLLDLLKDFEMKEADGEAHSEIEDTENEESAGKEESEDENE